MTQEEYKNIDTGDVLIFTPDLDGDSDFSVFSKQAELMRKHNAKRMIIEVGEGQYGFKNSLTYEVSLQREDGSFPTHGEVHKLKFVTEENKNDKFVEKLYDMQFLGYLMNYLEFMEFE